MKKLLDLQRFKPYLWIGFIFLLLWLFSDLANHPETFPQRALNNLWRLSYVLILNYVLLEYAIPFVGRKRKSIAYNVLIGALGLFLFMMLYSYGLYTWRRLGIALDIYTSLFKSTSLDYILSQQMSYSVMSVFFFGIIMHVYNYNKLRQSAQQLRIEKQQAELSYLKSQTNPHFLFNTLNNIYSLARDKNDLAPESILRLSKILRFMLYETGGNYISIEQELKIISDYIALERLRYDESLSVNFNYNIEDMKQAVPPLLLIPLVENAFKHGASETRGNSFVDIHLELKQRELSFVVKNSMEPASEETAVKENIGLSNLRRQLQLLYTDYNLTIKQETSYFTAILNINLGSHV